MKGRKELTIEEALKQKEYQNILFLIADAQTRKKKISSLHLKYILVKDGNNKLSDKERKELYNFFKYKHTEIWSVENGRKQEVHSIIDFLVFVSGTLNEYTQITSMANLDGYLDALLELKMIKLSGRQKRNRSFEMTRKGFCYLKRHEITETVELFLEYIFKYKRPFNESLSMLSTFESDIEKSISRLISSD